MPAKRSGPGPIIVAVVGLILLWQVLALVIGQEIILVAPWQVVVKLVQLLPQAGFWATIGASLARIVSGFLMAFILGVLAALASANRWAAAMVATFMSLLRSVPVASIIVLLLIWSDSTYLSLWVSFLMVLPLVCSNAREGIDARDRQMAEMAQVFGLTPGQRWWAISLPGLLPYLRSAARVGFGMAWKAGVSAELIGIPTGSIGERLYQAKLYVSTADLFAWTAVIVALSYLCERVMLWGLGRAEVGLGRYAS